MRPDRIAFTRVFTYNLPSFSADTEETPVGPARDAILRDRKRRVGRKCLLRVSSVTARPFTVPGLSFVTQRGALLLQRTRLARIAQW